MGMFIFTTTAGLLPFLAYGRELSSFLRGGKKKSGNLVENAPDPAKVYHLRCRKELVVDRVFLEPQQDPPSLTPKH